MRGRSSFAIGRAVAFRECILIPPPVTGYGALYWALAPRGASGAAKCARQDTSNFPVLAVIIAGLELSTTYARLKHWTLREGVMAANGVEFSDMMRQVQAADPEAIRRLIREYGPYILR